MLKLARSRSGNRASQSIIRAASFPAVTIEGLVFGAVAGAAGARPAGTPPLGGTLPLGSTPPLDTSGTSVVPAAEGAARRTSHAPQRIAVRPLLMIVTRCLTP